MSYKKLIPCIFILNGEAVGWFHDLSVVSKDVVKLAKFYDESGADELIILDLSDSTKEHDKTIEILNKINRNIHIPIMVGGHIKHIDDVAEVLESGSKKVIINFTKENRKELLIEASEKYGMEKIAVSLNDFDTLFKHQHDIKKYSSELVFMHRLDLNSMMNITQIPSVIITDTMEESELFRILHCPGVVGLSGKYISQSDIDYKLFKEKCEKDGIKMTAFESILDFSQFKLNSDGLIPVVVQHYKTKEVLMVAYMNEEAFEKTIKTGRMTYYSRSRQKLWLKGETSGHYQYVQSITIDCDNDTLLAMVDQVGAACHTGNRSCFFTPIAGSDEKTKNAVDIYESVITRIKQQSVEMKDGSSFKETDRLLKELGGTVTDLIIHTKNSNNQEIKKELSKLLYQIMILMSERKIDSKEILSALENL